ncbi:MAG TPA: SDR family oxidoreductase [Candidatus Sulfotelmatobacter sp.]|nr:SDR family oxidoreductase [Candidatus Sulfotelmatobacter sp.]
MDNWALITGASAGIGRELAKLFAADGFNLVLVARAEARLQELAAELQAQHSIQARVVRQDLAQSNAAADIFHAVSELPVSVLVNNAGFGSYGPFAQTDLGLQTSLMQVNMVALVQLTHLFLQPMLRRQSGRILNVASVAAFQPGPTVNIYYASKAFVYSFSYALAAELKGSGITVTALCPGTTRTEFFERAHIQMKRPWPLTDARRVAEAGYRGMLRGKRVVIPGLMNRLMAAISPCLPSALTAGIVRRIHEPDQA